MAQYTYYFGNLTTGAVTGALPLKGVTYSTQLNAPGTFAGYVDLADPSVRSAAPIDLTTPAKSALWIDRGGVLTWGGIIWGRQYNSTTYQLSVSGSSFDSYGSRRYIDYNASFVNTDQVTVAASLWNTMQTTAHGNINCPAVAGTSGVNATVQWAPTDFKYVTDALKDLTNSSAFDYTVTTNWASSNVPAQQMIFGAPNLGRTTTSASFLFDLPGNILSYTVTEDGAVVANTASAIGAGSGTTQLVASASSTASLTNGYPVLTESIAYKDVTDAVALKQHAIADLALYAQPVQQLNAVVLGGADPIIGSYSLGDYATVRINDFRFLGVAFIYQIRSISVAVDDNGVERVTLILRLVTS